MLPKREFRKRKRDTRLRCPQHLQFVRTYGCVVRDCRNVEDRIDAAHVKTGTLIALGRKSGDDCCVSMCRTHHREQHAIGEAAFMAKYGLDLPALAAEFAAASPALRRVRQQQTGE